MKMWLMLLVLVALPAQAAFKVPELRGPVNDYAGLLMPQDNERLSTALRRLWHEGGSQVAVLTVPNLDGDVLEQASIAVVEKWKLGGKSSDNGVLLFIAKDERKMRIEVGRGLEGVLPDIYAKRIVADVMKPLFQANKPSEGIVAGVTAIVGYTDPKVKLGLNAPSAPAENEDSGTGTPVSFGVILALIIIVMLLSRRRGFGGWWGGGGMGGGGGGDGGGFSGGGGSFNGGGASDGW